ncbi:MAG: hypothetical protein ACKPKO_49860, partial [Candidatus Fonsibacter sp.]
MIWLRECWTKEAFKELEQSELDGSTSEEWLWTILDFALSRALQGMIKASGESLSEDVTLRAREYQQRSMILRGGQIIWMMIDYCKTNRSLQEQYTWQDIELLQWQGDDKLQWFYSRWKLITTSLAITIPEVVMRDTFLAKNRNSKRLQTDIV